MIVRIVILFSAFLLLSCVSTPGARKPANSIEPFNEANTLTYSKMTDIVKNEGVESVAGLLKILGERYPDYLMFRTAMYDSDSLQSGTFTEPRVIVFGPTADFIFTFNGNVSQRGGGTVEAMVYDSSKKDFNFHEIAFLKEDAESGKFILEEEIDFKSEKVQITKGNPTKCMDCHSYVKTGPIWENHFFWPGAYGSNDDLLYGSFMPGRHHAHGNYEFLNGLKWPRSQGRGLDLPDGAKDAELQGYLAFLKSYPLHPRYRYLPAQPFEAGFRKFAAGTPVDKIDEAAYIRQEATRLLFSEPDRPNGRLGELLQEKVTDQLVAAIDRKPGLRAKVKEILKLKFFDYPFTWGGGRIQFFYDYSGEYYAKLPWLKEIEERRGAFKFHIKKVVQDEFELQRYKTEKAEGLLGTHFTVNPGWAKILDQDKTPAITEYGKLLQRSPTRIEILGMEWEAGVIPQIALLDFVLMDAGIDLENYEINNINGPLRKLSLHSYGLYDLMEKLGVIEKIK